MPRHSTKPRLAARRLVTRLLPALAMMPSVVAAPAAAAGAYTLSATELAYDCKKLTGRMQVRMLQIRNVPGSVRTSELARTIQKSAKPVFGGTSHGADPDAQYAADVSMLEAYNRRLVEKNCASLDLQKALAPSKGTDTPQPTVPPPAGKAADKGKGGLPSALAKKLLAPAPRPQAQPSGSAAK